MEAENAKVLRLYDWTVTADAHKSWRREIY